MTTQGISYNVDIVLCIDCTASMVPFLAEVKNQALKIQGSIEGKMEERSKRIHNLRARVIGYRDFYVDAEPLAAMPDFVDLRTQAGEFESFVKGLSAQGGGDEPENGLEALALALQSNWSREAQAKSRQIVVVWTDASAHPLEKAAPSKPAQYPQGLPKSLDELTDRWNAMPLASRRLLLFTPDAEPWSVVGASWAQVVHLPSKAGEGLQDMEWSEMIDAIAASV